jgi:hypothetical protein
MLKHPTLLLALAATLSGCTSTPLAVVAQRNNPRVVERDLTLAAVSRPPVVVRAAAVAQPSVSVYPVAAASPGALVDGQTAYRPVATISPTVSVAPVPAVKPSVIEKKWEVRVSDVRLSATFERWARESADAGSPKYKVLWDAEKHVLIDATPTYSGTIFDAIESALKTPAIAKSPYPLEACVYDNEPPLVRITKRGEQADACPDFK